MDGHSSPYFLNGSHIPLTHDMMIPKMEVKLEPVHAQMQSAPVKEKKKPGRKRKNAVKQEMITDHMTVTKPKRKIDRFKGVPESEVLKKTLPDHLAPDLDIVIVGINPGLFAASVGHHYAGPGNHFWKCMFLSGLIKEQLTAYDDFKLLECGIGFTNIVERTSRGSADLSRKEIKEGAKILIEKMNRYKPKICVFNGKGIYEVFCGHKNFAFGKQPEPLEGTETTVYVMPSSSARCAQLPRAVDKVPFYVALKKLRDYLRGDVPHLDESEVCFPDLELKVAKKEPKQEPEESKYNPACQNMENVSLQKISKSEQCASACNRGNSFTDSYMSITQEQPYIKQEQPYNPQDYGGMSGNYSNYQQNQCRLSSSNSCTNPTNTASFIGTDYNSGADNSQGSQLIISRPDSCPGDMQQYSDNSSQMMGTPALQENQTGGNVSTVQAASHMMQCQSLTNMAGSVSVQCSSRLQQYQYSSSSQAMSIQGSAAAMTGSYHSMSGVSQTSAFAASQRFQISFSQNMNFPGNGEMYNGQSHSSYPQILPGNNGQCWADNSGQNQTYDSSQNHGMVQVKEEPTDYYGGSSCPYQNG